MKGNAFDGVLRCWFVVAKFDAFVEVYREEFKGEAEVVAKGEGVEEADDVVVVGWVLGGLCCCVLGVSWRWCSYMRKGQMLMLW